jgi:hypothetical protein
MARTLEDLKDEFRYHPPSSQERIDAHNKVNQAAFDFAATVFTTVTKDSKRNEIIQQIQIARMMANQAINVQYREEGEQ